ncbi:MAG: hypothetical protein ACRELC_05890, partial [Gemmatimonadota bacterium]
MPEPGHASVSPSPESVDPSGTGLIVRILGGAYHVDVGDRILECSLRGRIKQKDRRVVSVGDRVRVGRTGEGSWRIEELLPRRSALTRHGVA